MENFDVLNERGEFEERIASRNECHEKGLWHRAIYGFIFNENGDVLLQRRAKDKKMWPDLWDVSAGGHVLAGEYGEDALIREVKEELGIDLKKEEFRYFFGTTSENVKGTMIDNHYNECYIITKNVDIDDIKIQKEEVQEVRWFPKEDIIKRIENDFDGITGKTGVWNSLKRYYAKCEK